jgi:histidinol-phosphate aminotransferase
MNNIDRRQWLKSIGLAGTMAFINPAEILSIAKQQAIVKAKSDVVKLNFNENPYGPSKRVQEAMNSTFENVCRYPFSDLKELVRNIAAKEGVPEDHIVVTGGSTEGLRATGLTYGLGRGEIIAAHPTFQAMLNYAENLGAYVHRVPVNDKMEHD